jgi:hypothetical protein
VPSTGGEAADILLISTFFEKQIGKLKNEKIKNQ